MQCIFSSSSIHSLILCVRMGLRDVKLGSNTHKAMYLLKNLSAFLKDFFLRSEEHTSELQSQSNLVCRLLLEKKKLHLFSRSRRNTNNRTNKHHYMLTTNEPRHRMFINLLYTTSKLAYRRLVISILIITICTA